MREHIQGEKYLKLDIDVSCVIEIFCCLANLYSQMRNYLLFTLNNTKVPNALIQLQNTKTKMYVSRYPSIFLFSLLVHVMLMYIMYVEVLSKGCYYVQFLNDN